MRREFVRGLAVAAIAGMILVSLHAKAQTASAGRTINMINVQLSGTNIWLPSSIVVSPGERVTLKLDNKVDAQQGFAINEYGIAVVLPAKSTQEVSFTAKKGASRFYCQLHPAHIGGNVIVL
ncbi:MAG TPA: cupredoxin domain-containing protein [Methylomirabilota bacterium]|nr:cupredoxin domain-containing protein [Methylomirabilota bacterium]